MAKQGGWESTGFGDRLKQLREAANLSQEKLATLAGCHRVTIAKLEQNNQEPSWALVLILAQALDVSVVEFIPEEKRDSGESK